LKEPLPRAQRRRFQAARLPFALRVAVLAIGWLLVLIGIVGLFLPVLQGGLSLALGFALLSIASQTVHLWLRGLMGRWPKLWRRMEKLRRRLRGWLHRGGDRGPS
jgi:uncharacterized membrane protein YbaN (DUF454 family)